MVTPEACKISVLLLTFNHERFVGQAIEQALAQRTSSPFEIVIGEDASTDATPRIVADYGRRFPDRIRVLSRSRNLGLCGNFLSTLSQCRGQYVAILEGDDFWVDPQKLEKQAAILDTAPDCAFTFHDVATWLPNGEKKPTCCPADLSEYLELEDFLVGNPVPNCSSVMFRKGLVDPFPRWYSGLQYYDWPLHVLHANAGTVRYVAESWSVYRVHRQSAWHGASPEKQAAAVVEILQHLDKHFEFRYRACFRVLIREWQNYPYHAQLRQAAAEVASFQQRLVYRIPAAVMRLMRGAAATVRRPWTNLTRGSSPRSQIDRHVEPDTVETTC
jgi:glycosyltransferase involved in cell wall biosynthesis